MAREYNFLLLGKTGSGKSATGNTLLRRPVFESRLSATPVTKTIDREVSHFEDRVLKVVDTPGLQDTQTGALELFTKKMEAAVSLTPSGYHALLLVMKFGQRFTVEDLKTVRCLKAVLGEDVLKTFAIITLTGGDDFENETERTGKSFTEWCRDQTGGFQTLLNECGSRVVLFDNLTENRNIKQNQFDALIKVVDSLQSGQRYTDEHFARARKAREEFLLEVKRPRIGERVPEELSLILMSLQQVLYKSNEDEMISHLDALLSRTNKLSEDLREKQRLPGSRQDVLKVVKLLNKNIMLAKRNAGSRKDNSLVQQLLEENMASLQHRCSVETECTKKGFEFHQAESYGGDASDGSLVKVKNPDRDESERDANVEVTGDRHEGATTKVVNAKRRNKEDQLEKALRATETKQMEKMGKLEKKYRVVMEKIDGKIMVNALSKVLWSFKEMYALFQK